MFAKTVTLVFALVAIAATTQGAEYFPGRPNQTYIIQQFGRGLVWEPEDGELATGTRIMLSPLDPTKLTQFWTTKDVPGYGVLLFNAAAPNYMIADWAGTEGYNAVLRLSRAPASTQMWNAYAGDMDAPPFAISAMSPRHYRVHGEAPGLPLVLFPGVAASHQQWEVNRNFTPPAF